MLNGRILISILLDNTEKIFNYYENKIILWNRCSASSSKDSFNVDASKVIEFTESADLAKDLT